MEITCSTCQHAWTGLTAAHCSACHHTFTSVAAFDKHRTGSHAHETRGCLDPATVGLVTANRAWPGWSFPGSWDGPQSEDAA